MRPPSDLLTDPELDRLSDFFESLKDAMNIERFDGFLCALVSGPEVVMLSEYWPIALGCDPAETEVFSTPEQAQEIFSLVVKHWNSISTRLDAGEIYEPVLLQNDAGQASGIEWANGFLEGVALRRDSWSELFEDEDSGGAILPILALAHENHPDPSLRYPSPLPGKRDDLLAMMMAGLVHTYEYFKQRRTDPTAVPITVKRSEPKIGRNEPCPCGSGQKYKNCCLRKMH
jgi:uncharacterized protein